MQADDELRRAVSVTWGETFADSDVLDVLEVLGRIGPVTAWILALREHRKRVENDTGSPLPDQSQWGWKDVTHAG
jgi:hypothetical protein